MRARSLLWRALAVSRSVASFVVVAAAFAGAAAQAAPAPRSIVPPVFGTPGLPGTEVRGGSHVAALGLNRSFARMRVQLELAQSCLMSVSPNSGIVIHCSDDMPFASVLMSDADPAFEETIAFSMEADGWRPSGTFARISAQRLVVDY